jgi:2-polyprenyl-6-methoxyphenol hydroxylase-like FAD-dependent oxidoreductase
MLFPCRWISECAGSRDPALLKQVALQAMQGCPEDILDVVRSCDTASMSLTQLCYRAPWHMVLEPFREGTVTVAGDAMHVMGPFIGQGGSASLEDAVVIARSLAKTGVFSADANDDDQRSAQRIEEALKSYVKERKCRILRLSVQAFLNGQVIIASSELKKVFLKAVLKVLFGRSPDNHSDYDCGSL